MIHNYTYLGKQGFNVKHLKFLLQFQLVKLLVGTFGIYMSYVSFGVIQQKMFNVPYKRNVGTDSDLFPYTIVIALFPTLLCGIMGQAISYYTNEEQKLTDYEQVKMGLQYFIVLYCTNIALIYVSFPVMSIFRNMKFLAVVIYGVYFSKVERGSKLRIGTYQLLVGIIITTGVILFSISSTNKKDNMSTSTIGILFLTISVLADAFLADSQAYVKKNYEPTANQLFTCTNFYTFVIALIFSLLNLDFFKIINFIVEHKGVGFDLFFMSLLGCTGQISLYYIVRHFKQHITSLITTVRKIFTVLLSIIIYHHKVTFWQWIGIIIVFAGVLTEACADTVAKRQNTTTVVRQTLEYEDLQQTADENVAAKH